MPGNSAQNTIEFIFLGQDKVSSAIAGIGSGLEDMGSGIEDFFSPFADAAKGVLALDAAVAGLGVSIALVRDDFRAASARIDASVVGTAEEIEALDGVMRRVFQNNFGQSADEAGQAVIRIQSQFKDLQLSVEDIQFSAESAFSLRDLWDADIQESLGAVRSVVDAFGLDVREAFDFVSAGFEQGLNSSGDFLDSVTEYATQFKNGGAGADQFFSVLKSGLAEGILGTDKAADSFKEFRIRITEGGSEVEKALGAIGINAESFGKGIADGSLTAIDAFQRVIEGLRGVDDRTTQYRAGVALLGTQFEDLGTDAALAIDTTTTKMDDLTGATERTLRQYDTLGNRISTVFRTAISEIADVDAFQPLEEQFLNFLEKIAKNLPEVFDRLDWSGVVGEADDLIGTLNNLFGGVDITSVEGLTQAVQTAIDTVQSLLDVTGGIVEAWGPLVRLAGELVTAFNSLDEDTKELVGNFLGISQQAVIAGGALAGVGAAMKGLSVLTGTTSAGLAALAGPVGLGAVAAAGGVAAGSLLREYVPAVDKTAQSVLEWIDSLVDFSGTQGRANESIEEAEERIRKEVAAAKDLGGELTELQGKIDQDWLVRIEAESIAQETIDELIGSLGDLEKKAETPIELGLTTEQFKKELAAGLVEFEQIPAEKAVLLTAETDRSQLEFVTGIIEETLPDGTRYFTYQPEIDPQKLDETAKAIEEKIPPEKRLAIETDLQIAEVEADARKVEAALDFKAKVDVAEIEAAADVVMTLSESMASAFESTGQVISSLFGSLSSFLGTDVNSRQAFYLLQEQLEKENDLRERALKLQEELIDAQIRYMDARRERMDSGEALIRVDMDGRFEPALEFMAREFIRYAQIWSTEEGKEFLLGFDPI